MIKKNGDNVFAIASSNNQCQDGRSAAVSLCPGTRIPRATAPTANRMTPPDAQHNAKEVNIAISTYVEKWKNKYEESERKNKGCLLKSEKAKREHEDLQRRYNILHEERNHLERELGAREGELNQLRTVSEQLFQEYQNLKHQHEVDQGVMQKVMQQAGEWYKQNKQLKRRSTALLQALPTKPIDIDFTDSNDNASDTSSNEEVEFLKATLSELTRQTAELQGQLAQAQVHEFEAHELNVALAQDLETERATTESLRLELQTATSERERLDRVSRLLLHELDQLRKHADEDRHAAETYKSEASQAKKRVRVLTHQSALLSDELTGDERTLRLLQRADQLQLELENQALEHSEQIQQLQLKLAEKDEETDELLWEEKIKLAEEDAERYRTQAENAERKIQEMERKMLEMERRHMEEKKPQKKSSLMSRISYFENAGEVRKEEIAERVAVTEMIVEEEASPVPEPLASVPAPPPPPPAPPLAPPPPPAPPCCAPPPPPPPPPPAPPLAFAGPIGDSMATLLQNKQGTLKKSTQSGGGAIDAIVDQIKGGKFHLKSTDQNFMEKKKKEDKPEAVKEMLAILGTLRKRRSVLRGLSVTDTEK